MEKIFAVLKDGVVNILNEKGNYVGKHLVGNDWVSVQVNGDMIMATNESGRTQFFDKDGNYRGHA